jgi:hypothetical protein
MLENQQMQNIAVTLGQKAGSQAIWWSKTTLYVLPTASKLITPDRYRTLGNPMARITQTSGNATRESLGLGNRASVQ